MINGSFQYLSAALQANWVTLICHLLVTESDAEIENVRRAESETLPLFNST